MKDCSVEIAGIRLAHPIMNAAGVCDADRIMKDVVDLAHSKASAIMVGPITVEPRTGNKGKIYESGGSWSLNSKGWPSPGEAFFKEHLAMMVETARALGKPLFVNIAGLDPSEYAFLAKMAFKEGADLCELDLGCGNLCDEAGKDIPIPCFNPLLVMEILKRVEKAVGKDAKVAIKVAPFTDSQAIVGLAKVVEGFNVVKALTTMNTFPNAILYDDDGMPVTKPRKGLAGLGGPAIKPIALGQVMMWREALPKSIDIIGVGGASRGIDVLDFRRAGATAVQVGTAIMNQGSKILDTIVLGYFETVS